MILCGSNAIRNLCVALIVIPAYLAPGMAEAHGRPSRVQETLSAPLELHPLLAEARRHLGQGNFTGFRGPWCAVGLSKFLTAIGLRPLPNAMAASALSYGPRTSEPRPGDIVVMRRHVAIYEGIDDDGLIRIVSANWGNRVAEGTIDRRQVVAFIRV